MIYIIYIMMFVIYNDIYIIIYIFQKGVNNILVILNFDP